MNLNLKKLAIGTIVGVMALGTLTGCVEQTEIEKQEQVKVQNAMALFQQTKVPTITKSLERENIRQRIMVSNDPNTLQWIYPMSAGRVIGRFPVKGKVTSGSKRLTSSQNYVMNEGYTEAPDEMGVYGSSSPYIFWFDPAGQIHQWQGDYFVSPVPYMIDKGYGTIDVEIDAEENRKAESYKEQIKKTNADLNKQREAERKALEEAQAKTEEKDGE